MKKSTLDKTNSIKNKMIQQVVFCSVLFISCLLLYLYYLPKILLEIITTVAFAAIAIVVALGLADMQMTLTDMQMTQEEKAEEIRHIERSLEMFYRPLQDLFNGHDGNEMNIYEDKKEKYNEIGYCRDLAKSDALRYFEKCQQTNENLKDLLKQVDKDISDLQDTYKQLKEEQP